MAYADIEERRAYARKYWEEHKEEQRARQKAYRDRHPERMREQRARRKYGISPEEHRRLLASGCGICGTLTGKICIDHDHGANVVRGALCDNCNVGLGRLGDSLESAEAAVRYLKECAHSE